MAKYLIKWKSESFFPPSKEERLKNWMRMAEMVKEDIASGVLKDWGVSAGSGAGYAIVEGTETDVWELCVKYRPFVFLSHSSDIHRSIFGYN
jgi:hypothetical protein